MSVIKVIAAAATLIGATASAAAQDWPTRPVTLVVLFAAGGPMDPVGRILALRMSEFLRQQVVVENVGGAGGMANRSLGWVIASGSQTPARANVAIRA
jgi:tripartite-type tricarboxylate transporter receptor subunit TctC